jgi:hypothetical protein
LARPVATFLEYAFVAAIFQELSSWKSGFISQACPPSGRRVWAREVWKIGMMGLKEKKIKFTLFRFHISLFHMDVMNKMP